MTITSSICLSLVAGHRSISRENYFSMMVPNLLVTLTDLPAEIFKYRSLSNDLRAEIATFSFDPFHAAVH